MVDDSLWCEDFRVSQASHIKDMFDDSLQGEKFFEAGLSGFPRRHMSKVCLKYLCNVKSSSRRGMSEVLFGVSLSREKLFEARLYGSPSRHMSKVCSMCEKFFQAGLSGCPRRHTSKVCLMYLCRAENSLWRGFLVAQASHVKDICLMYKGMLDVSLRRGFPLFQASHVKGTFDVPLSCGKLFEAELSGIPRRRKLCLMCLCRVRQGFPGFPGVTCQRYV